MRRLTHEEQVAAIAKVNPNIEVLGEITGNDKKVLCRCKICDYEWLPIPNHLKRGRGCPKCAGTAKLTHEEQIAAIAKVNPDIEVIGEIINDSTKVLCRCKVCDHEWSPTPNSLKSGQGCPKCYNLRRGQNQKLSHKEQVAAIAKVNPDIEVLEEITGNDKKVLCRCKVCDHEWSARPSDLKHGHGCPKCKGVKCAQRLTLSHEEQIAAIAKVNPDIEVLGEIVNGETKVLCHCKVCSYEWSARPSNLKRGIGCPKCGGTMKLPHEEQIAAIAKVNPDVEVLGEIVNDRTKVLCRCKVCDHEWLSAPDNLKQGRGCRKCWFLRMAKNQTKSHKEHLKDIYKVNPDIEVLEEITGSRTKVLCRCKVCDHEWMGTPNDLKHGHGCPKCAKRGFLSHDYGKLYIMVDDQELPTQMKIGVSIQENKRRNNILRSAHKAGVRFPDLHIVKTLEGSTENIQELERTMHKAFSNYKINFPVKFDGSNEFFYYRPEVLDMVEEAYKEIVAANEYTKCKPEDITLCVKERLVMNS